MASHVIKVVVYIGTLPYYRLFQFNTIKPIRRIAACTRQRDHSEIILHLLIRWRERKLAELHFVSIACAILAAAVIGSFSWNTVSSAYWLAPALWYCSLFLSVLGILLSAQQMAVLNLMGDLPAHISSSSVTASLRHHLPLLLSEIGQRQPCERDLSATGRSTALGVWKPRWKMVFTWQCPVMFMSYSVCLFLAGLTILVCTPLIRGGQWSGEANVAVVYLLIAAIAGTVFIFCSFWVYHFVDLESETNDFFEAEARGRPQADEAMEAAELTQSPMGSTGPTATGIKRAPLTSRE